MNQNNNEIISKFMANPAYKNHTKDNIALIVSTALSLNVDPHIALTGGLYIVRGKVEMSSRLMNSMIRSLKHSVSKDRRSDATICILHGKRADNGDTWTAGFSVDEAKKAGLMSSPTWQTWTEDMLFARAFSRLARQLFPDVIGNCYVEGELSGELDTHTDMQRAGKKSDSKKSVVASIIESLPAPIPDAQEAIELATSEQVAMLLDALDRAPEYKERAEAFLEKRGIGYQALPLGIFTQIYERAKSYGKDGE